MVKAKKDDGGPSSEEQASVLESKRLQDLAVSRGLLSRSKANPAASLLPTKTILKCDGKDIVKKGHRKTKYLFAFPGLVAPIAGGKFGELTHLDSRNPTCYVDFPQGRLKLFGTIVYPKNKYLTMHFVPGRGNIVCEDCFESIVVFPQAWWIGTKEENPEELRLAMPSNLQQDKHPDFDFSAGAGRPAHLNSKAIETKNEPGSPAKQFSVERLHESPSSKEIAAEEGTLRRSARRSAEKPNYALSSDGEESSDCASESSDFKRKRRLDKKTVEVTSLSVTDVSIEEKVQEAVADQKTSSVQATVKKEIRSLFVSTGDEQVAGRSSSRGGFKQGTLASFFAKTDTMHVAAPNKELIEIEESPQKAGSGGIAGVSALPGRTLSKKFLEELEDAHLREGVGQTSSESTPKKNVDSGRSRGRGRGRGRGAAKAAPSEGQIQTTPRKSSLKRRQSITETSSSDEDDRPH